jgi:hypothetical protein
MSQSFKFNLSDVESKPDGSNTPQRSTSQSGYIRNLCFVWPDGSKKFLNYAYLISGEYFSEPGSIKLIFTSDHVTIDGINLDALFGLILEHSVSEVIVIAPRYQQLEVAEYDYSVCSVIVTSST